jgi:hypothetical protein
MASRRGLHLRADSLWVAARQGRSSSNSSSSLRPYRDSGGGAGDRRPARYGPPAPTRRYHRGTRRSRSDAQRLSRSPGWPSQQSRPQVPDAGPVALRVSRPAHGAGRIREVARAGSPPPSLPVSREPRYGSSTAVFECAGGMPCLRTRSGNRRLRLARSLTTSPCQPGLPSNCCRRSGFNRSADGHEGTVPSFA